MNNLMKFEKKKHCCAREYLNEKGEITELDARCVSFCINSHTVHLTQLGEIQVQNHPHIQINGNRHFAQL